MKKAWSDPVTYNLKRTLFRASIPKEYEKEVPETPGTYVIIDESSKALCEKIVDIGETGLRPASKPHGLRGRLASNVSHSASERIALDIKNGKIAENLSVVWYQTETKREAKAIQDALITLFCREYKRQPLYNKKVEIHRQPEQHISVYIDLKIRIGANG
jgi:hypothetical protein